MTFDPQAYGPALTELLDVDRCRELGPGRPNREYRDRLQALSVGTAFAHAQVADQDMARCCISGVWLLHDFLDESHTISQNISTPSGSYWHGIMHRREPDYSNAKYWFRRVGSHPVFEPLGKEAQHLAEQAEPGDARDLLDSHDRWDPILFVDLCQAASRNSGSDAQLCRQLAQREWELLFDHCYHAAVA